MSSVDPMAAQMARLIAGSDLDELREIVRRWIAEAPIGGARKRYEEFGSRMLELKTELTRMGATPSVEELEVALTMMMKVAAGNPGAAPPKIPSP
jgi:hypothetical protein